MKLEHTGIAVTDLEQAIETFEKLLGCPCYKRETVEGEQVSTAFFKTGESKIELLGATGAGSVIAGFLKKRGEGVHHIAFEVESIEAELRRLKAGGFTILNEKPKRGADNKLVAFLHPGGSHGVLIELCQSV